MTCDSGRPCRRCVQRGLSKTCEDAPRKRKKYLVDVPNNVLSNSSISPIDHSLENKQPSFQLTLFQDSRNMNMQATNNNLLNGELYQNLNYDIPQQLNLLGQQMTSDNQQTQGPNSLPNTMGTQIDRSLLSLQQVIHQHQSSMLNPLQQSTNSPLLHSLPQGYQTNDVSSNFQPLQQQLNNSYNPKKRTNFLSSAAGLEYSTLSNILQDSFAHPPTSTEGTPNSMTISPSISYQAVGGQLNKKHVGNALPNYFTDESHTSSPTNSVGRGVSNNVIGDAFNLKCDDTINQYFLGVIDNDVVLNFPEVLTGIESLKTFYPEIHKERCSRLVLSFAIGLEPNLSTHSSKERFKEPEEIYVKVRHPYSYTPGFHSLIAYLRKRFPREMLVKMAESMAAYRPSFIACTNSLKEGDLIFMEQCFQRTLLTYDGLIKVSGTPTIVWRRTGEIAYVGSEFCVLTGWKKEELLEQRKFIVELLDDESVVEYFELFLKIAFGDFLGATMTECTLLTPNKNVKIRTGCIWTLKRDVFGIPMMIIGNFLPIV